MLSRYLKTATRLTFRSFSRISMNKFSKNHFEKSVTQFRRWESNSMNTHNPYGRDQGKGSKNLTSNTLNQQTRDKDYNPSSRPTDSENMPFNQKLNKVPFKHPYASERKNEKTDDPLDVMYENVAKDEDINPKDSHFNQDSVSPSATSKNRQLGKDNLYDMTLIQNDSQRGTNSTASNAGDRPRQPTAFNNKTVLSEGRADFNNNKIGQNRTDLNNKVGQNSDFQKLNQDENFNDIYVGDVEHKIPTKNLNAHHKQVVTEHLKNKDINKDQETTSAQRFGKRSNVEKEEDPQYTVDNHENYDKNMQKKKGAEQKSKMMEGDNFDLASGSFTENIKKYENKMKNDDTMANPNLEKTPSNEDYYLKDNNSEYNKFMSDDKNKNRNEDREFNKNKMDKNKMNKNKRSDDQYSKSSKRDDSEMFNESDDSKYNDSSRNKQM